VDGAENYLKNILEPLLNKCSFLVDSQTAFKNKFLTEKIKFDPNQHELVSFDIKAMYPNINVTRTVSYIIATIFRDPTSYFKQERDNKSYFLPTPTKAEFKDFLLGVIRDYNYFEC
jgi:hypothetical protein